MARKHSTMLAGLAALALVLAALPRSPRPSPARRRRAPRLAPSAAGCGRQSVPHTA